MRNYLLISLCFIALACKKGGGAAVDAGSQVSMHYTLTVDGNVVDSSRGKDPLSFVQGKGQLIKGVDQAVLGMAPGESKKLTISPENGYGKHDPRGVQKVPRTQFGKNAANIKIGGTVSGEVQGKPFRATVTAMDKQTVTLDLNHPLAGKTLNFDIEIVSVAPGAKS